MTRVTVTPDEDLVRSIKRHRMHGVQNAEQYKKQREREVRMWFDAWNDGDTVVEISGVRYCPAANVVFAFVSIRYQEGEKVVMFEIDKDFITTEVWSNEAKDLGTKRTGWAEAGPKSRSIDDRPTPL